MDGKARLVWNPVRNRRGGTQMDVETAVRLATTDEDHNETGQYLTEMLGPVEAYRHHCQTSQVPARCVLEQ